MGPSREPRRQTSHGPLSPNPSPTRGEGDRRTAGAVLSALFLILAGSPLHAADKPTVVIVVGAEGAPEFGPQFRAWAERWVAAAKQGNADSVLIGTANEKEEGTDDRGQIQQTLAAASQSDEPLWLVLLGHGTFDGKTARFNLRGPDVTPAEIREWLRPVARPLVIVNCASCSGPFLAELSGPNRVVVTATKTGHEYNFARFGDYLSAALVDPAADLDKDEQTSLLEAYLAAASRLREFYAQEARLATEHPLLDDNGDRLGTPSEWFQGLRAVKTAKSGAALDGPRAAQLVLVPSPREQQLPPELRERRDALERDLAEWRRRKPQVSEDEYFTRLETLLVELARLADEAEPPNDSE